MLNHHKKKSSDQVQGQLAVRIDDKIKFNECGTSIEVIIRKGHTAMMKQKGENMDKGEIGTEENMLVKSKIC